MDKTELENTIVKIITQLFYDIDCPHSATMIKQKYPKVFEKPAQEKKVPKESELDRLISDYETQVCEVLENEDRELQQSWDTADTHRKKLKKDFRDLAQKKVDELVGRVFPSVNDCVMSMRKKLEEM